MKQHKLFPKLEETIDSLQPDTISEKRKEILQPLIVYIKEKQAKDDEVRLNFICTHNSRRSHLSQIWAQTLAHYFKFRNVQCYSGGTEAMAMFPKVGDILAKQGFLIQKLSETDNPVYAVKYSEKEHPIICFSKTYENPFNPTSDFGAIMTCDSANEACPMVLGAEVRLPITYQDPKAFDNTSQQDEKYLERSIQIATELYYVFGKVTA